MKKNWNQWVVKGRAGDERKAWSTFRRIQGPRSPFFFRLCSQRVTLGGCALAPTVMSGGCVDTSDRTRIRGPWPHALRRSARAGRTADKGSIPHVVPVSPRARPVPVAEESPACATYVRHWCFPPGLRWPVLVGVSRQYGHGARHSRGC